ncbi:MAG: hypothetical protein KC503_36570 [Myxococcales bacterium]|nr:hypothetical protein [Myxococcales bacterium]
MKPRFEWVLMVMMVALLAGPGCGDSGGTTPDAGKEGGGPDSTIDVGVPDLTVDTTVVPDGPPPETNMGEGCSASSECKAGSPDCVLIDTSARIGICSKKCTPDDTSTPLVNEDDCPNGFVCGEFRFTSGTNFNYCLKKCTPSLTQNPCPASSKTSCDPASTRFSGLDQTVCWFLACTADTDCPVMTAQTCTTNADCSSVASDAFCENRVCARPGKCSPGGICAPHTLGKANAKPGDPCTSDLDCANNGFCLTQDDTAGLGPAYRNGYCTVRSCAFAQALPEFACPTGSTCHNLFFGGLCHKTCDPATASDCRNGTADQGGDYECYAWNNLSISGINVTTEPVCQNAPSQTCDGLGTQLDCTSLAPQGNPQNMGCRDRNTGVTKTQLRDPTGVCLDDTPSGTFQAAPDGGMDTGVDATPDTGADAGVDTAPDTTTDTTTDTTGDTSVDTTSSDTTVDGTNAG